ncbi:MAG: succinylglutamate desuccinylase/aspartoacylase family protein [Proteobacteria bacterium]|nr:succinylglutamate desuccinylase/aspartoacylase family protein [Pseudomonadota bacterium]
MPRAEGHYTLAPNVHLTVLDSGKPGPTALIQAGIHGDEVAGVHALQELLEESFRPDHGRLLIVPVMNVPAYRVRQRKTDDGQDLNRSFPGDHHSKAREQRLAAVFMDLVRDESPALVATLHESKKRYDPNVNPSFGQTLVYGVRPMPPLVGQVVDQMNAELTDDSEHWATQHYPVATSSTEVIVDAFGCIGICVETWMGFDEPRRIRMQRRIVELLLEGLGVQNAR